jgi:type II secretory pathway predicted ATPase ExeA
VNMHADTDTGGGLSPFLTYEPFYRLREKPFSLSSDPRFLYKGAGHRAAFDQLSAGIRRREGLIVLSGEIGMGKTTLCRAVLAHLDRKTFSTFVPDPFVTREDLLKMLLIGFGVVSVADLNGGRLDGASRQDLSYPLYEFLDSLVPLQAFAVLVIDEAQNLSLGLMEEIRILAELEKREKLLQVVLVGQPELRANLRLPQMRQVDQRVTVRCELSPLTFRDVIEYVGHRLVVAAAEPGGVEFTGGAIEAVHLASGGVPRLINLICDRSLQRGFESRTRTIDRDTVASAVHHLGLEDRGIQPDTGAAIDILPLPFEADPAAVAPAGAREATPPASAIPQPVTRTTPQALAVPRPAPEPESAPLPVELVNPLSEFDSEPEAAGPTPRAQPQRIEPVARSVVATLARVLGLATAALGIAVGVGALDVRAAMDVIVPAAPPAGPGSPDRTASVSATALSVPDAVVTALIDARAHEPDVFMAHVASFHDRAAADRVVAGLIADGYRARWAEVRTDDGNGQQQVYVDGYGTLEDALAAVTRLRQRETSAQATLFRQPGAMRRPASAGR